MNDPRNGVNDPNDAANERNGANGTNGANGARSDGPVFHGPVSQGQFAWGNENVTQNQQNNTAAAVAPGYEELAERVRELLAQLPAAGLPAPEQEDTEAAAAEVLAAIGGPDAPEPGRLRRALAMLRGALTPVAMGAAAGTTVAAQEWALTAIRGLTGV
ncbi:hypothetical protein [Streptomyces sp. NPDC126499]|uniref:hypothetical protein n=1 Tax=Streptomyces sp. NPDC126499 TaxID=3155314 RepID=UPI00332EE24B